MMCIESLNLQVHQQQLLLQQDSEYPHESLLQTTITIYHFQIFQTFTLAYDYMVTSANYSVLKLFTGLATAALIAWKLTVARAINITSTAAIENIHQLNEIL